MFFTIGIEKSDEGFWYEDIDSFQESDYNLGLSEDDVNYINRGNDKDDDLHAQLPRIITFFRSCQMVFLLADFAATAATGSMTMVSNSYVTWINQIAELVPTAIFQDISRFLYATGEESNDIEDEDSSEHNHRMTNHLFFICLGHSVFLPIHIGQATTVWDVAKKCDTALVIALENLRNVMLIHCFFNQDTNKVQTWFDSAVTGGKVTLLESFYALLSPPSHIANDPTRADESKRIVEWLKNTIMSFPASVTSLVAKLLEAEFLVDIKQRAKLVSFFTILQSIYLLSQPKPEWKGSVPPLLDLPIEELSDDSMYSTLAHFTIERLPDYNENNKTYSTVHFSHLQWLELLYATTGPIKLADVNVHIDIESYCLPLLHTLVKAGNFPLVKYLVEKAGADIDAIGCIDDGNDPMYVSALNIACLYSREEIAQYLLTQGATVNHSSTPSPFVFAVQKKIHLINRPTSYSPKITQMLFHHQANGEEYENSLYFDRETIFPAAVMLFSSNNKKRREN